MALGLATAWHLGDGKLQFQEDLLVSFTSVDPGPTVARYHEAKSVTRRLFVAHLPLLRVENFRDISDLNGHAQNCVSEKSDIGTYWNWNCGLLARERIKRAMTKMYRRFAMTGCGPDKSMDRTPFQILVPSFR